MKYKASKDIPRLAAKLNTMSPSEIANAATTEFGKKVSAISVSMWLQRHPDIRRNFVQPEDQKAPTLHTEEVKQKIYAELYVNNAVLFQINDLSTLQCARKYLDIVEEILK
jgi:rRNA maturation protein Rpf1